MYFWSFVDSHVHVVLTAHCVPVIQCEGRGNDEDRSPYQTRHPRDLLRSRLLPGCCHVTTVVVKANNFEFLFPCLPQNVVIISFVQVIFNDLPDTAWRVLVTPSLKHPPTPRAGSDVPFIYSPSERSQICDCVRSSFLPLGLVNIHALDLFSEAFLKPRWFCTSYPNFFHNEHPFLD